MDTTQHARCTAFEGYRRIASGTLADVAVQAKTAMDKGPSAPVLIFDDETGEHIEVDYQGTVADVRNRLKPVENTTSDETHPAQASGSRSPGRPKLGVVAHEVTLLPRHWDWLYSQPGGASVALRKLVEQARKDNEEKDRLRIAQEAALPVYVGNRRQSSQLRGSLAGVLQRQPRTVRGIDYGVARRRAGIYPQSDFAGLRCR